MREGHNAPQELPRAVDASLPPKEGLKEKLKKSLRDSKTAKALGILSAGAILAMGTDRAFQHGENNPPHITQPARVGEGMDGLDSLEEDAGKIIIGRGQIELDPSVLFFDGAENTLGPTQSADLASDVQKTSREAFQRFCKKRSQGDVWYLQKNFEQLLDSGRFSTIHRLASEFGRDKSKKGGIRRDIPPEVLLAVMYKESQLQDLPEKNGMAGTAQFMPCTARTFGLRVDKNVDERMDDRKSVRAMAQYLRYLSKIFNSKSEHDLVLPVIAYHRGEGFVMAALQQMYGFLTDKNGKFDWKVFKEKLEAGEINSAFVALFIHDNFHNMSDRHQPEDYVFSVSALTSIMGELIREGKAPERSDLREIAPSAGSLPKYSFPHKKKRAQR